jgi:protein-disulfide isomerase
VGPLFEGLFDILGKDKISVVFKHFPLGNHDKAQLAAEASMAAHAQGKFWEYHDILFQNQKALERYQLESYAQRLSLDMAKFKASLDEGVYTERVKEDMAVCQKAGVRGTPTIFVNGRKYEGAREAPAMAELLKKEFLK